MQDRDDNTNLMDEYLIDLFALQDPEVEPSQCGMGIRAHLSELFSDEFDGLVVRLFVQLYAECTIPGYPSDIDLGYTEDDIITKTGIVVASVESRIDPPAYMGEAISIDRFITDYAVSPIVAARVRGTVAQLTSMAMLGDAWLDGASTGYNDRKIGSTSISPRMESC